MKGYSDATKRFLLAAKNAEIQALQQLSSNCKIVTAVTAMIHQMQRERGCSNIYLASKGERFASQRSSQLANSDSAEEALRSQLKSLYLNGRETASNMRLLNSITLASQGMDNLSLLRDEVNQHSITPLDSTRAYSRLIAGLLAVIFEAADVAGDPSITRLLVALFNFIQGKEYAGQERAWGALGFAETHFNKNLCERLEQLQVAQQHSFEVFSEFAQDEEKVLFESMITSQVSNDLARLRDMIRQLADGSPIAGEISEVWYDITTARIDEMQRIEEHLAQRLISVAQDRVAQADAELRNHKTLLKQLDNELPGDAPPITMLFDPAMPGLQGLDETEAETSAAASLNAHRSFYDLLRAQADHIKQVSTELEEAKRAINEQKMIDRAKLLIMQNLNMTEDQAYRRLQKSAMDENCRLAEVALKVVNATARQSA